MNKVMLILIKFSYHRLRYQFSLKFYGQIFWKISFRNTYATIPKLFLQTTDLFKAALKAVINNHPTINLLVSQLITELFKRYFFLPDIVSLPTRKVNDGQEGNELLSIPNIREFPIIYRRFPS